MGQATLSIILDVLVIVLLVPTIVFAVVLNGRLAVLRRNREELSRLVAAFNEATVRAEAGIPKLKRASDDVSRSLLEKVDRAHQLRDDLAFMVERAESASARMDLLLRGAKVDLSRPDVPRNEAAKVEQARVDALRAGVMSAKTDVAYADLTVMEPGRAEAIRAERAEAARLEAARAGAGKPEAVRPDFGSRGDGVQADPAVSLAARVLAENQASEASGNLPTAVQAALPAPAVMDIETAAAEAERLEREVMERAALAAARAQAEAQAAAKAQAEIAKAAAAAAARQSASESAESRGVAGRASLAASVTVNRQEPTLGPPGALVGSVAEAFATAASAPAASAGPSGGASTGRSGAASPAAAAAKAKPTATVVKPTAARATVLPGGGSGTGQAAASPLARPPVGGALAAGAGSVGGSGGAGARKPVVGSLPEDDNRSEAERDLLRALQSVR